MQKNKGERDRQTDIETFVLAIREDFLEKEGLPGLPDQRNSLFFLHV
jgi:hypothetical protein